MSPETIQSASRHGHAHSPSLTPGFQGSDWEGLIRDAVQSSAFGVTIADAKQPDFPLIYVNDAFERLTGYASDEILGLNCRFLQGPDTDPSAVAAIRHSLCSRTSVTRMLLNYRKDGRRFWNRFQLSPVRDPSGALQGFLGMQVDITEDVQRVGLETERQKLETLGQLAGGVAHELNNALQPISLYAEMLGDLDGLADDAKRECIAGIRNNASYTAGVVQQILSFARRDSGAEQELVLADVMSEALDFATELTPSGVSVARTDWIDAKALGSSRICINRVALFQVLVNLFKNAADASDGRGTITVGLSIQDVGIQHAAPADHRTAEKPSAAGSRYAHLRVCDEGHGMDDETLKHIFEPFYTTKAPGQGTGLGLSTIYGIVESWRGRIWAESTVGKGTTFHLLIPLTDTVGQGS
ncbi:MAG: ATP-binding protein [Pseudomonadota bacterium]